MSKEEEKPRLTEDAWEVDLRPKELEEGESKEMEKEIMGIIPLLRVINDSICYSLEDLMKKDPAKILRQAHYYLDVLESFEEKLNYIGAFEKKAKENEK